MRCYIIYQPTTRDYFPLQRSFAFSCHQLGNEDRLMNFPVSIEIIRKTIWYNGNRKDFNDSKNKNMTFLQHQHKSTKT